MAENKPNSYRRLWRWAICLLVGLAIPVCYMVWEIQAATSASFGFQPPGMALAQYTPKDVVGDLGGMKVRIPRHYAEYVEYDGDPGFGEKRKGPVPERTFESKLRGFGMDVRYPDMKGLEDAQTREEKRRQPLRERKWLYVIINAGQIYPGRGFLDRRANGALFNAYSPAFKGHWQYTYERLPEDVHELEMWVLSGTDPRTGRPARESEDTKDVYIHRQPSSAEVDAYIDCRRTYVPGGVARCDLSFSLEPKAEVRVGVSFPVALLPEWKTIRQSVRQLLVGFEVTDIPAKVLPSSPAASASR